MSTSLRSRATPATRGPVGALTQRIRDQQAGIAELPRGELLALAVKAISGRRTAREDLQRRLEALTLVLTTEPTESHQEPAQLVSWANRKGISRQAMQAKAAGVKSQRALGGRIARAFAASRPLDAHHVFVAVHLCRVAPNELDNDNLESAFKAVRDGIATGLGANDRSPRVRYVCSQEQGGVREHLVRAELFISICAVHQDRETP